MYPPQFHQSDLMLGVIGVISCQKDGVKFSVSGDLGIYPSLQLAATGGLDRRFRLLRLGAVESTETMDTLTWPRWVTGRPALYSVRTGWLAIKVVH